MPRSYYWLEALLNYVVELERTYQLETIAELKARLEEDMKKEEPSMSDRQQRHQRKKKWRRVRQCVLGALFVAVIALTVGRMMAESFTSVWNTVYVVIVVAIVGCAISLIKRR
ncbi:MAG: DUF3040 domain-containing protein [Candidatus Latescibacteria bacterium]|nr:DUF3040 domain-containing protein [Candidatus Latescibacterota bacterium]